MASTSIRVQTHFRECWDLANGLQRCWRYLKGAIEPMNRNAVGLGNSSQSDGRLERERTHYNKLAERVATDALKMPRWNIDRYHNPEESTVFPLEYAFHLMGDIEGKTVLDLGCGDGLNTVILASLGAKVLSVDISDKSLEVTHRRAKENGVAGNVQLV